MLKMKYITLEILILLFSWSSIYSQHTPSKERGDVTWRQKSQMQGNQVKTTIYNYGHTGRPNGDHPINVQTPYEWPKNTGKVYLAQTQLFMAGEVVDQNGQTQKMVVVNNGRLSPQGKTWELNPVPGYYNKSAEEIANSASRNTWPTSWPDKMADKNDPGWSGKWNGYFGKDKFNADMEIFYRASDDNFDKFSYLPDTTDPTRHGLGMIVDSRTLAWSQFLVQDVVYLLFTIKNDGTKDINRFGVTFGIADFVGGDGDTDDDLSEFDLLEDIMWSRDGGHGGTGLDGDNKSSSPAFGNDPVGIIGLSLLETPGNNVDRIDNDGDGEDGVKVSAEMIVGEDQTNQIDDNGNGLIDENKGHIPFAGQLGVSYADYIDSDGDAEANSPVVTQAMITEASGDKWKRWPSNPENDAIQKGKVHLLMVESEDLNRAYRDWIDNNDNGEDNSPVITQEMINTAAGDAPYYRFVLTNGIILFDVKTEDLGKKYADGLDNDGNGAIDERIDENIDEMIDEERDNGIDDDGDWDVLTDDVGLDGVAETFDTGEGDGKPTSGAGTNFPGEPNIDITDVSETDQIGITNAARIGEGALKNNNDLAMWNDFMIPGQFYERAVAGKYDLFCSTSFFPMKAGSIEPMSVAVILANGPISDPNGAIRKSEVLKKRVRAQETYNNDYQFANAPLVPTLTAIPGNNNVTLYWDGIAEDSYDAYIANIGGIGHDFEGYKIYRSSDPAFEDATTITNGQGVPVFKQPIAQFDIKNDMSGYDSVGIDGIHYYLGSNSGLTHKFVDSTAKNGFTYYYAIVSYDRGFAQGQIMPSECPIKITLNGDGSVQDLGVNVVRVKPEAPAAGFQPATLGKIELIQGTTSSKIYYDIVDKNKFKDGHEYYVTFEDTLVVAAVGGEDTLRTLSYTLVDSTAGTVLIDKSRNINSAELPLIDGFRLIFANEKRVEFDKSRSDWNADNIPAFNFEKIKLSGIPSGVEKPNDYRIIFGDVGVDTSLDTYIGRNHFLPQPVNFRIYNISEDKFIDFAFQEMDLTDGAGKLTYSTNTRKDYVYFFEKNSQDSTIYTWRFYLNAKPTTSERWPASGDIATVYVKKPFLSQDIFKFTAQADKINLDQAKADMNKIKVVPNPYIASADWEPKNPYNSGRGPRSLHFTHLPSICTIRIYTVSGELVKEIRHESQFSDGSEEWDLLSKDNLSISYGVYVYHIDAPNVGEKIGKFAIIK